MTIEEVSLNPECPDRFGGQTARTGILGPAIWLHAIDMLSSAEHGLNGGKFLQAFDAEFGTETRLLDSAEGCIGLDRAVAVDPHRSAFELQSDLLGMREITTPDRATETHRAVIRFRNGLRFRGVADDRQSRAELFDVHQLATVVDISDESDRIEIARPVGGIAP